MYFALFESFELSGLEQAIFFVFVILYRGIPIIAGLVFLVLIYATLRALFQKRSSPYRRSTTVSVIIIWTVIIFIVGFMFITAELDMKGRTSYNKDLALQYAKTYDAPVVLPSDLDYKIDFDQKWGQIELHYSGKPTSYTVVQVPLTEIGRKYFDAESGICDFSSMRENYEILTRSDETCSAPFKIKEFTVYYSSRGRYYAIYQDVVVAISIVTVGLGERDKLSEEEASMIINDFRVTDTNELVTVIGDEHFTGSYAAGLDIRRKEGKF